MTAISSGDEKYPELIRLLREMFQCDWSHRTTDPADIFAVYLYKPIMRQVTNVGC